MSDVDGSSGSSESLDSSASSVSSWEGELSDDLFESPFVSRVLQFPDGTSIDASPIDSFRAHDSPSRFDLGLGSIATDIQMTIDTLEASIDAQEESNRCEPAPSPAMDSFPMTPDSSIPKPSQPTEAPHLAEWVEKLQAQVSFRRKMKQMSSGVSSRPGEAKSHRGSDSPNTPTSRGAADKYKTELCRTYMETHRCPYGQKCQFAHGEHELREVERHSRYKSVLCMNYHQAGYCSYGRRCCFVHEPDKFNIGVACLQDITLGDAYFRNYEYTRLSIFKEVSQDPENWRFTLLPDGSYKKERVGDGGSPGSGSENDDDELVEGRVCESSAMVMSFGLPGSSSSGRGKPPGSSGRRKSKSKSKRGSGNSGSNRARRQSSGGGGGRRRGKKRRSRKKAK